MNPTAIISEIRKLFQEPEGFIPLHAPTFAGNEKKYVVDTIDSTFVSSVGAYVTRFEQMMCEITGAKFAIATTNGTSALHLALVGAGVKAGMEVVTQPLTFVATANAIAHAAAKPVFVDVDKNNLGLSPEALATFLEDGTYQDNDGNCINKTSGAIVKACIPMHTFGFPAKIQAIREICREKNIVLIEDAAESLGSYVGGQHTGTFGDMGVFSFNGNKIATSGGGGAIVTNDESLAKMLKHISTTAKIPHQWEFSHDLVGYNYRLPNINAALACAQLEQLPAFLQNKRKLADEYAAFFSGSGITFVQEQPATTANYWLNTIILNSREERDEFLRVSNDNKVMTRPIWKLMNTLPMYSACQHGNLDNATWLESRIVNIPSSVRPFSS